MPCAAGWQSGMTCLHGVWALTSCGRVRGGARRLLRVKSGGSLGPLWREVEHAAKNNCLLPSLPEMRALMEESHGDVGVMRDKMVEARKRQKLDEAEGAG